MSTSSFLKSRKHLSVARSVTRCGKTGCQLVLSRAGIKAEVACQPGVYRVLPAFRFHKALMVATTTLMGSAFGWPVAVLKEVRPMEQQMNWVIMLLRKKPVYVIYGQQSSINWVSITKN